LSIPLCVLNAKHTWVYDTLYVGRIGDTIEDLMERELFKLRNIVHSSPPPFRACTVYDTLQVHASRSNAERATHALRDLL